MGRISEYMGWLRMSIECIHMCFDSDALIFKTKLTVSYDQVTSLLEENFMKLALEFSCISVLIF